MTAIHIKLDIDYAVFDVQYGVSVYRATIYWKVTKGQFDIGGKQHVLLGKLISAGTYYYLREEVMFSLPFVCPSVCPPVCLSVRLSVCPSVCVQDNSKTTSTDFLDTFVGMWGLLKGRDGTILVMLRNGPWNLDQ